MKNVKKILIICALMSVGLGVVGALVSRDDVRALSPTSAAAGVARDASERGAPAYLPAGARVVSNEWHPEINGRIITVALPGAVNADTLSQATFADGTGHPATTIKIAVVPDVQQFPGADSEFFTTAPIDVNGAVGRLVETISGVGPQEIVWQAGDSAYRVSVERRRTSDGLSGVSIAELLRVARSI